MGTAWSLCQKRETTRFSCSLLMSMSRLAAPPRFEWMQSGTAITGPSGSAFPNLPDDFIFAGGNIVDELDATLKRAPITTGIYNSHRQTGCEAPHNGTRDLG